MMLKPNQNGLGLAAPRSVSELEVLKEGGEVQRWRRLNGCVDGDSRLRRR